MRRAIITLSIPTLKQAIEGRVAKIIETSGPQPTMQRAALRGIADETTVYEIP
jgi:hypothetical protein